RCRVPHACLLESRGGAWLFVLEDLDASGFPGRHSRLSDEQTRACLSWLAYFHAEFLGTEPRGLWEVGTYWHLATRPEELRVMRDERLRAAAPLLDERLNSARYQTLVHGDAKVANFCFGRDAAQVAAVDFQYVGGGVGVKDLAYFLSSCLDENDCLQEAERWVGEYFRLLREAVVERRPETDVDELEREWRALYPVAWADFVRFLVGWAPEHYKIHGYSKQLTEAVLTDLA
ncbi:MAG: oxidoreductase family protein, partial [Planctomycetota bacterium]